MKKAISLILALIMLAVPISASAYDYGIDVSHNNGNVDFAEVKNGGNSFVMIRLGYYNHLDENFLNNVKAACEAGMEYGVYIYSYAFNDLEAQIEAQFVLDTLASLGVYKSNMTLPVAYDVEDKQLEALKAEEINSHIRLFCTALQDAGYVPMVFSSYYFFNTYIDTDALVKNGWKLWLSKWEKSPDFSTQKEVKAGVPADIWQYQSGDKTKTGLLRYDSNIAYDLSSLKTLSVPLDITAQRPTVKTLKASKSKLTVKWKQNNAASGYEIQISTNKSFKKKQTSTKTADGKATKTTFKKLKRKKKYYVRIRAYKETANGMLYSKWSKKKTVKMK